MIDNANDKRRSFLSSLFCSAAALGSLSLQSDSASAHGGGEKGASESSGPAKEGAGRGGRGGRSTANPADLAKKWMEEFDKDGDGALNAKELNAAIESFFKSQASARGGMRGQAGAAGEQRGGAGGKGGGAGRRGAAKPASKEE